MPKLMTHLVANYPNLQGYEAALQAILDFGVDFLEIQLPFSNPLADGPLIYQANQQALQFHQTLKQILSKVNKIYQNKNYTTKLFLMSYLTPILALRLEKVVNLCSQNNVVGFIIPDLVFGSKEEQNLSNLCRQNNLQLIPVISPLTTKIRLEKIKNQLQKSQIIYAMARSGRTGNSTDLTQIQPYLDFLTQNLKDYQIVIGFGIKEKSQVKFLNDQDFIAVIGSEIIRQIQTTQKNNSTYQQVITFLNNLN